MSFAALLPHRATVIVREASAGEDAHGNPTSAEITHNDVECFIIQRATTENVDGQDLVTTQTVSAWLPGAPINAGAQVLVDIGTGPLEFEVVGDPAVATNARTGAVHHLEAVLTRSTG